MYWLHLAAGNGRSRVKYHANVRRRATNNFLLQRGVTSMLECARLCTSDCNCAAFNVQVHSATARRQCELIGHAITHTLVVSSQYSFYER